MYFGFWFRNVTHSPRNRSSKKILLKSPPINHLKGGAKPCTISSVTIVATAAPRGAWTPKNQVHTRTKTSESGLTCHDAHSVVTRGRKRPISKSLLRAVILLQ